MPSLKNIKLIPILLLFCALPLKANVENIKEKTKVQHIKEKAKAKIQNIKKSKLKHAITLYGSPKYSKDFTHFNYTNPDAPKGGELRQAAIGTFDTLNPYIDRGTAAAASNLIYDTLLARSWDEPLTKYGYIAEKIELDPKSNWVAFHVNPKARFHDDVPLTAHDVKFSFDLLRKKGSAFYKNFYREIESAEVTSSHRVVFHFNNNKNKELPLILGQMPILPEHYWKNRDFSSPGLNVPVGSGPYKPSNIIAGRSITYERVKNYWGQDLAVNKGRFNFDRLKYEYYRDNTVALEALLVGRYDFKLVDDPKIWNDHLNDKILKKNKFTRLLLNNGNPQTLTLTYNTRRPFLQDIKVREALGYAFNFDWINNHQFHGMYKRATSYFSGTQLAATDLPNLEELKKLTPWKSSLPSALFKQPFVVPGSDTKKSLSTREKKKEALKLLESAGWKVTDNIQSKDGKKLELEALIMLPEHEKSLLVFQQDLKGLGIKLNIRSVDASQYIERIRNQDFDLIMHTFPHTPSPGTEQASQWGSTTVNQHGTKNLSGANLEVIDELTAKIADVNTFSELQSNVKAMDRVLLWQHYSLPLWYLPVWPIVHKDTIQSPSSPPPFALDLMTWWHKPVTKK
ncbi:MAG: extracellular solute-binding protein [Candidatus Endonucleobacter bathymodioli]|uniref:Extracellular solute-binding protein n=1 Tax=Candidatus Endonucleibacter bathymodioli TaxID=539814 RepID=A0AA90NM67_9GAMM|nr:extracellular solute-binding protein [Candidatus Endonucleobacter bathymodioli]